MKRYSQQTFRITKNVTAYCWTENTSYGFRHLATLDKDYREIATNKCCYYNRTWECYQYESVLKGLLENVKKGTFKTLTDYELKTFKSKIKNQFRKDDPAMKRLKMVSAIASLGEIFGSNQTEKNDWKARMLKAGLPEGALIMPEEWDTLSEDQKETRLNGSIQALK